MIGETLNVNGGMYSRDRWTSASEGVFGGAHYHCFRGLRRRQMGMSDEVAANRVIVRINRGE